MLIRIKTIPSSNKEYVLEKSENSFEISIKEDPIGGKATKRVVEILAERFEINQKQIRIIKGGKARNKIFEIPNH